MLLDNQLDSEYVPYQYSIFAQHFVFFMIAEAFYHCIAVFK